MVDQAPHADPWAKIGYNRCPGCKNPFAIGFGKFVFFEQTMDGYPPCANFSDPQAGDLTICPWCGAVLRFSLHRRVRKLEVVSEAEMQALGRVIYDILKDAQNATSRVP